MPDNGIFWLCSNSVIVYRHMQLLIRFAGWAMVWAIKACIPLRGPVPDNSIGILSKITPSILQQLSQCIWSCRSAHMRLLSHKGLSSLVRLIWSVSWYPKLNPESKCSWALLWFLFKEFIESQVCTDRLRQLWSAPRQTGQVSKCKVLLNGLPCSFFREGDGTPFAWKIPWMEEPGRLQSMGSLRVGHDWATPLSFFTFHFHAVEKEMATHSSILAWRIPGTEEPSGLPSMVLHRVGHD